MPDGRQASPMRIERRGDEGEFKGRPRLSLLIMPALLRAAIHRNPITVIP
jgi:hypothetical protein